MRGTPARPEADLDPERHVEMHGGLGGLGHDPLDHRGGGGDVALG